MDLGRGWLPCSEIAAPKGRRLVAWGEEGPRQEGNPPRRGGGLRRHGAAEECRLPLPLRGRSVRSWTRTWGFHPRLPTCAPSGRKRPAWADREVPLLLQTLAGEPRRRAAQRLVAKLKKNLREEKHRGKIWVAQLREAAQED